MTPEAALENIHAVEQQVASAVLGQHRAIRVMLSAVIAGGHVLVEDRPGVGKTTMVKALAGSLGLEMRRVQGTSDLLPSDITGTHVYEPSSDRWVFHPGPITAPVVLVDELNRATPRAQSALLEAMAERQVSVNGETIQLPDPHVVLATQNPPGELGTYRLGTAQVDRFAVVVSLGAADRSVEEELLSRTSEAVPSISTVGDGDVLRIVREHVAELGAGELIVSYVLDVVHAVRKLAPEEWLSTRVPLDLLATARGHAFLSGRDYVAPDDVQRVSSSIFRHRLGEAVDIATLADTISAVDVPTSSVNG